jgi:hypothetical protein
MISDLKVGVRMMLNNDSLMTQRVCDDICLSRVIVDF